MKTLFKIAFLLSLAVGLQNQAEAQTVTSNTTLCAALPAPPTNFVCMTSTTGLANNVGIYVDQEFMTVVLSNNTTVCTGPCSVPVRRGGAAAGSGPTAHANGAIAWVALGPTSSIVPGINGFDLGLIVRDIGTCTRTAQIYLPKIYPNRGIKRDCTTTGVWVDFAPGAGLDFPSPTPITTIAANGALSVSSGNYELITKAGVIALTLAAPTAGVDDGMIITISANNGAYADTLTATALIQTGGAGSPYTTATFGVTTAFNGASLTLKAIGGYWFVISASNVAFT